MRTCEFKLIKRHFLSTMATFQVLGNHVWLVAIKVDSVEENIPIILESSVGLRWSREMLVLRRLCRQTEGLLMASRSLLSKPLCKYTSPGEWTQK